MNNIAVMRMAIADVYEGQKWKSKVSMMPTNQVIAVYKRFSSAGLFNRPKRKRNRENTKYRQMTIFDYI